MPLTDEQREELRGALDAEKDALDDELSQYGVRAAGEWEGHSESEGEEADPNDAADNIEELAVNVPLVAELKERRTTVSDALKRMNDGVYGTCEVCDEEIPFDRLEADPAARTCIKHA